IQHVSTSSVECMQKGSRLGLPNVNRGGEKHWLRATATTAMTQIAIQEQLDGNAVVPSSQDSAASSLNASLRILTNGLFPIGLASTGYTPCQGRVRWLAHLPEKDDYHDSHLRSARRCRRPVQCRRPGGQTQHPLR